MRHRNGNRCKNVDTGATAVEFALVLPLLIMLVFGIIGFAVLFAQKLALSNSAREGSRFAAVNLYGNATANPHSCQAVVDAVRKAATTISMNSVDGQGRNLQVAVSVKRDNTTVCTANAGTATSSNQNVTPCTDGTDSSVLTTTATYRSELIIPLAIVSPSFDLEGKGVYRCEYK